MSYRTDRRGFLRRSAARVGAVSLGCRLLILPEGLRAASPNEKLNLAAIGVGGRGGEDLRECAKEKDLVNVVALCDVDKNTLASAAKQHEKAKTFADFRKMLAEMEKRIDVVVVGTPDHTHAPPAVMAMKLGKHCYCEKPLTHSVHEARVMAELAKANKLATQMGTQIHAGDNYRRVVELVQAQAVGPVREVHVWSQASYSGGEPPKETPPVPPHLDWDLWLGPAPLRPYHPNYAPFKWRGWSDFGNGGLGDFFCHYCDLVFWALKLRHPTSIESEGPKTHPDSCPPWLIVRYEYPARDNLPAVKLTWYDGGKRPQLLDEIKLDWRSGVLFVGEKGMLAADYSRHVLLPEAKFAGLKRPPQTIPASIGHHKEWLTACKTGGETTCNFDYSGALSESALLGTVAYRVGERIRWDGANLKAINCPQAERFVQRPYRAGWSL